MRLTKYLGAGVGALALLSAAPALAQDSDEQFTGFYVGGSIGWSVHATDNREIFEFDTNLDGNFNDTVRVAPVAPATIGADAFGPGFCSGAHSAPAGATNPNAPGIGRCRPDRDGLNFSIRAGYDMQMGNLVIGGVAEVGKSNVRDGATAYSTTPAVYILNREIDLEASLRARAGFASGPMLIYATGGIAYADIDRTLETTNTANSFTLSDEDKGSWGWVAGGGLEFKLMQNVSLGAEYLYSRYDDDDFTVRAGPGTAPATNPFLRVNANGTDFRRSNDKFENHAFRAVLNFRF